MLSIKDRKKRLLLQLPLEVSGEDAGGHSFSESTHSLNVSAGGILFESQQKLVVGSRIHLRIEIPPGLRRHFNDQSVYDTRAAVCRIEPLEGVCVVRVGARFLPGRRA
jgi:hypothetical protein